MSSPRPSSSLLAHHKRELARSFHIEPNIARPFYDRSQEMIFIIRTTSSNSIPLVNPSLQARRTSRITILRILRPTVVGFVLIEAETGTLCWGTFRTISLRRVEGVKARRHLALPSAGCGVGGGHSVAVTDAAFAPPAGVGEGNGEKGRRERT